MLTFGGGTMSSVVLVLPLRSLRWGKGVVRDADADPAACLALVASFSSCRVVTIAWESMVKAGREFDQLLQPWEGDSPPEIHVESLAVVGLKRLFSGHTATASAFARILAIVARGPLRELALTVAHEFVVHPDLAKLVFPTVTSLRLSTNPTGTYYPRPDLYTTSTHTRLTQFLSDTFPSLTTLHLQGCFNTTSVSRPTASSSSSSSSLETLAIHFALISSLLAFLRCRQVLELRFSNSVGHPEGEGEWCF